MRKVLGVNFSHHCSFAYFENGILKEYYEEDRFNKIKYFEPPDPFYEEPYEYQVLKKFKNITFDAVVFVSFDRGNALVDKAYIENIIKQVKGNDVKYYIREHHVFHAVSGFYFSKFEEAIAVISDGGGARVYSHYFKEMESIFLMSKQKQKITKVYQKASCNQIYFFGEDKHSYIKKMEEFNYDLELINQPIAGRKYMNYTIEAGFDSGEEGQLMGIAAYKDKKTDLDKNVLEIANKAQEETLQEKIELIEKALTYSNCKNIVLSGGYHLNCANNFKLVKHFPKLNFFVDPIAHDGGTAVGAAYYYAKNFKN